MHQLVSKETEIISTFSRTSLMEVVLREAFRILRGLWMFPTDKCCNPWLLFDARARVKQAHQEEHHFRWWSGAPAVGGSTVTHTVTDLLTLRLAHS